MIHSRYEVICVDDGAGDRVLPGEEKHGAAACEGVVRAAADVLVCKESLRTAADGKSYKTKFYNLDVIISVGYRVKSPVGTRFRQWANAVIKQYLLQGYSVNRHLIALQENMDRRMTRIEDTQARQQQQLDFFIRTSTPPAEMVLFKYVKVKVIDPKFDCFGRVEIGDYVYIGTIDEYIGRNSKYNLDSKGMSPEDKKRLLLSLPEDKLIRKREMRREK